jgi:hypothetical protein
MSFRLQYRGGFPRPNRGWGNPWAVVAGIGPEPAGQVSGRLKTPLDKTDWLVFNEFMNKNLGKKKQPQMVRLRILEAAAKVTVKRGLGGLTLELVAKEAGVSKGGLIHHYSSKSALINH